MPRNNYVRREPRGCPLTPRQWQRLDVIEVIDGVPVKESIEQARQIKLTYGRYTGVWVTEYLKRWKADFDTRPVDECVSALGPSGRRLGADSPYANNTTLTSAVKKLVDLAWG